MFSTWAKHIVKTVAHCFDSYFTIKDFEYLMLIGHLLFLQTESHIFFPAEFFLLKYCWLTMLCQFYVYHKVIQIRILFQLLCHYRLLQDIEYSSLCHIGGWCYVFKYSSVNPKLLIYPSSLFPPTGNHKLLFYICESLFCKYYFVSFFKTSYKWYDTCLSLFDLLNMIISMSIYIGANGIISFFF